jgi:hypothetical protein
LMNLGIVFNYTVSLFHRRPVRQGVFGRVVVPGLAGWFGWFGLTAVAAGSAVAVVATLLGVAGWEVTRLWLWLLGSALLVLAGVQLMISWVLMRVLEALSRRDEYVSAELGVAGAVPGVPGP